MKTLIILTIFLTINAEAKTKKKHQTKKAATATKVSYEDAKEHCLVTKGASISSSELDKCITEVMKSKIKPKNLAH